METGLIKLMSIIDDDDIREKYSLNENEYNEICKKLANEKYNIDRIKLIKRIYYIYNDIDLTNSNLNIKLKLSSCLYDFYSEDYFNNINNNLPYYLDINKEKKNINFKCNCLNRITCKNIEINQNVYIYKIEDVEYFNPHLLIEDDF